MVGLQEEQGLASIDEYLELVTRDLKDMLGSTIELVPEAAPRIYSRPNPREVWLQLPDESCYLRLERRALVFSPQEISLIRAYVDALHEFARVPRVFATTASEDVLTRAIAQRSTTNPQDARTLETVMQAVVRYASRTYEGVRVAVNLCIDFLDRSSGLPISVFLDQAWAPVLGSGLTTAILLAANGSVRTIIDLQPSKSEKVLAPESFTPLADWTGRDGRIAMAVTRSGEVYLFGEGQLQYARRNSRWQGFPISLLRGSGWFGSSKLQLSSSLKVEVLTSLLDASAAHHGACLGLIALDKVSRSEKLVISEDSWSAETNMRRSLFVSKEFGALSRRRRLELLSMDGATLIDQRGTILAGGAILRVDGGSPGGGRTAAAHAISHFGVGIKVSQDGPITAFVFDGGSIIEQFRMG